MVKYVLYGIGEIGARVAKAIEARPGAKCVGCIDIDENKVGKDIGEIIGSKAYGLIVRNDARKVLAESQADIVIHTTSSQIVKVKDELLGILDHRLNLISSCEELSYPYFTNPEIAAELDERAKKNNISILGTGINPGFLMDALPAFLTSVCRDVQNIEVKRVINASKRRRPFQLKIGSGMTPEEFNKKIKGSGHVGLEESICLIADSIGWHLEKIEAKKPEPVLAQKHIDTAYLKVNAGDVCGLTQIAEGQENGKVRIRLIFQAYLEAEEEFDSISIEGEPSVSQKISPAVNGDVGTVAMLINLIPKVIHARPGLLTMKDITIPSFFDKFSPVNG